MFILEALGYRFLSVMTHAGLANALLPNLDHDWLPIYCYRRHNQLPR
jgi:hypothetical protein